MKEVIKALTKFRDERNWSQFHTPNNLAKSITLEAAELLENFQWEQQTPDLTNIKDELADIMSYCLLMCEHYDLDPKSIILQKIEKNKAKYPIDKVFGSAKKYTQLK